MPESSGTPLTRRTVYDRLHTLLQHLLSLIPTMVTTLHPILVRHFPHKRENLASHITYIRNILRISEYCPSLADRIMDVVIDKIIQIDVRLKQIFMKQFSLNHIGWNSGRARRARIGIGTGNVYSRSFRYNCGTGGRL